MIKKLLYTGIILTSLVVGKLQAQEIDETAQILTEVDQKQQAQQAKIDAAFVAMDAVQKAGAYIESISDLIGNGKITLPVGIKKGDYELIIQKIKLDKETGKSNIFATVAFEFKDTGDRIAFEGSADIEGQKGLGTSGYLEIIAPVRRDIGSEASIIFNEGTRANFGCEGIESYAAKMDLLITSTQIKSVNDKGVLDGKALNTSFDAIFYDFENYTVSIGFKQSFVFNGLDDVIFTVNGVTLDQSDLETSDLVRFPDTYFEGQSAEDKVLWKGIAISEASISLPGIFKKSSVQSDSLIALSDSSESSFDDRITLALQNALIDDNGFTGRVTASDIIPSETIDEDSWDISLSDLIIGLTKNQVSEFGFGGDVNIPPLGKNSLLGYQASYNAAIDQYEFVVNIEGEYEFKPLKSTLILDETSTVELLIKDSEIYPSLHANGLLTIDAPLSSEDTTAKFSVPDISFQEMCINREAPHFSIGAIGVSGDLRTPKVAGFELVIDSITPFKNDDGEGLSFTAGIEVNEMFGGGAGILLYGDYEKWKFDRVGISSVEIIYESDPFSLYGDVTFKNGDAIYGNGFRGDLRIEIAKKKFILDAIGVFGKVDDYRYFLSDVMFEAEPKMGIPLGPLSFYGFGGGLYKKMQQTSGDEIKDDFAESLSGIRYRPDKTVSMGFMTSTKFCLAATPSAFNSMVTFEMQFNDYGGINFIQLRGDATFMDAPDKWKAIAEDINETVKDAEENVSGATMGLKSDLGVPEIKTSGFLTASMLMNYDLVNNVFTADFNTYLNAGVIKGIGENDRMGWASAYFSPDKWYTYMGTPDDRLGINILDLTKISGYFMLGDDILGIPLPPDDILQNFSAAKQEAIRNKSRDSEATGSGIAFGASLEIGFDAKLTPFYANFQILMGAEFLLRDEGEGAFCINTNEVLGINGWYAQAQAWAGIEAAVGLESKLFGKTRQFSIFDVSGSALLTGAGPAPFYFTGAVSGNFSVMGGLVSGHCEFDFDIGEECVRSEGSPFGENIIAQITPGDGESEINVFASPQVIFTIPVGLEMEIEEEGYEVMYRVQLEKFTAFYTSDKQEIVGFEELSTDGKIFMLDPDVSFESQQDISIYARVSFERKQGDKWVEVSGDDGEPLYEEKTIAFKSGDRPTTIESNHVKYSYPLANQYNYYPNEYGEGYIQLDENFEYLFTTEKPEGYTQVLRVSGYEDVLAEMPFSYQMYSSREEVQMEINYTMGNASLANNEIYRVAIVNIPPTTQASISDNVTSTTTSLDGQDSVNYTSMQADGTVNMLEEKEIYALNFRTSNYNTFDDKMAAITNYEGVVWQEYAHVYLLGSNIYDSSPVTEMFDYVETNSLLSDVNMVKLTPIYEKTSWYTKKVAPLMYENTEMLESAKNTNLKPPTGTEVVEISQRTDDIQLSDEMVESNSRQSISALGAFHYGASYYIDQDFVDLRTALANNLVDTESGNKGSVKFLKENHIPDLINGDYEILISYVLPGKEIVTSNVQRTIKLDGFLDE